MRGFLKILVITITATLALAFASPHPALAQSRFSGYFQRFLGRLVASPFTASCAPKNTTTVLNQPLTFTVSVNGGSPPYRYQWSTVDANPLTGSLTQFTTTFTALGSGPTKSVNIRVIDATSRSAQDACTVTVSSGGGGGTTAPPAITYFTGNNNTVVQLTAGQPLTLRWATTNTSSCSASGAWGPGQAATGNPNEANAVFNALAVQSPPYLFYLTCQNSAGQSTPAKQVSVTVTQAPPPSPPAVDIKANDSNGPLSIAYNTAATLKWTSTNATSCTASGGWSGSKVTNNTTGESTGVLTTSKTFTISCGTATDSVVVNVSAPPPPPPLPTVTLTANPTTITAGQSTTLSWSSTNTSSCIASGDWSGTKATSNSQGETVGPLFAVKTYTFSLACINASGATTTKSVSVTAGAPSKLTISMSPLEQTGEKIAPALLYTAVVCSPQQWSVFMSSNSSPNFFIDFYQQDSSGNLKPLFKRILSFNGPGCQQLTVKVSSYPQTPVGTYMISAKASMGNIAQAISNPVKAIITEATSLKLVTCSAQYPAVRIGQSVTLNASTYPLGYSGKFEWFLVDNSKNENKIGEGTTLTTTLQSIGYQKIIIKVDGKATSNCYVKVLDQFGNNPVAKSSANCQISLNPQSSANQSLPLSVELTSTGDANTKGYYAIQYDDLVSPSDYDYLVFTENNGTKAHIPITSKYAVIYIQCRDAAGGVIDSSRSKQVYDFRTIQTTKPSKNISITGVVKILKNTGTFQGIGGVAVRYVYANRQTPPVETKSAADGSYSLTGINKDFISSNDRLFAWENTTFRGLLLEHSITKIVDLTTSPQASQGNPVTDSIYTELDIRSGTTQIVKGKKDFPSTYTSGFDDSIKIPIDYGEHLKKRIARVSELEFGIASKIIEAVGGNSQVGGKLAGRYFGIWPQETQLAWCTAFTTFVVGASHGPNLATNSAQTMTNSVFTNQAVKGFDTSFWKLSHPPQLVLSDIIGTLALMGGHTAVNLGNNITVDGNLSNRVKMCISPDNRTIGDFVIPTP